MSRDYCTKCGCVGCDCGVEKVTRLGGITEIAPTPRLMVEQAQEDFRTLVDKQEVIDYTGVATLDFTQMRIQAAMYKAILGFTRDMADLARELHTLRDWEQEDV